MSHNFIFIDPFMNCDVAIFVGCVRYCRSRGPQPRPGFTRPPNADTKTPWRNGMPLTRGPGEAELQFVDVTDAIRVDPAAKLKCQLLSTNLFNHFCSFKNPKIICLKSFFNFNFFSSFLMFHWLTVTLAWPAMLVCPHSMQTYMHVHMSNHDESCI